MKEYTFIKNFFSESELTKILFLEKNLSFERGLVGQSRNQVKLDLDVRQVQSANVYLSDEKWLEACVNEKLSKIKKELDDSIDISGGVELNKISFLKYEEGDFYNWHLDNSNINSGSIESRRALSLIVQLSDPLDYEEGDVLLKINGEDISINKEKNSACAFLSRKTVHKVCPVKSGVRKSIVAWAGSGGHSVEINTWQPITKKESN